MPLPDISSLDDYGGVIQNYGPVTDPTTDEDAKFRNRYACDVAMMGHSAPRGFVRFISGSGGGPPADPVSNAHDAMWGSLPAVKPVVTRTALGEWLIALPTTVEDELTPEPAAAGGGVVHTVNVRAAIAQATATGGVLNHVVAEVVSANTIVVRGYAANGTADDIVGSTITVVYW